MTGGHVGSNAAVASSMVFPAAARSCCQICFCASTHNVSYKPEASSRLRYSIAARCNAASALSAADWSKAIAKPNNSRASTSAGVSTDTRSAAARNQRAPSALRLAGFQNQPDAPTSVASCAPLPASPAAQTSAARKLSISGSVDANSALVLTVQRSANAVSNCLRTACARRAEVLCSSSACCKRSSANARALSSNR